MVIGIEPHCFGMRLENEKVFGPNILEEVERQVRMAKENMRIE
jgi:hypothetical protein